MGSDKSLIEIDGVAMAERVARVLDAAGCAPVRLIGGNEAALARLGRAVVADQHPGAGPLGGVLTALSASAGSELVVVVACDLPDLGYDTVGRLIAAAAGGSLSVADSGRIEPMLACWPQSLADRIERSFAAGQRALHEVLAEYGALRVPVEPAEVRNVNHPDDLGERGAPSVG